MAQSWRCRVTWRLCCRGQRHGHAYQDSRDCISVYMRCWQASGSSDHGSQPVPPPDCWSVSSSERLLAGQLRLGLVVGLRLAAVWCRGSMPLQPPRDTARHDATRCMEGWALAVIGAWVSVCIYRHCADVGVGWGGGLKSAVRSIQALSETSPTQLDWHHDSLIGECLLKHFWATHQHGVQNAPCLFFYRCH
jgi:hypothetical protein